jgi:hypothetical protein
MRAAAEHIFTGTTAPLSGPYDSTKTMIGSLMKQYTGSNSSDKYISSLPSGVINQVEVTGGSFATPHVFQWSANIFWVFVATNASAAVTRNIGLYEFDSNLGSVTWKGFITLSGTTFLGNKSVRAVRGFVYEHTSGTVSTTGTSATISGSSTLFQTDRIAAGARIGFGTTDPTQVSTWYEIASISSDSSLTISGAGVSLAPGTSYVIEEIRLAILVSNATATNSGIHLIKGLNYGTFTTGGTTILEASLATPANTDNIRASYLLRDPLIAGLANTTCTISQAAPGIVTVNGHGLIVGDPVSFTTTGALPTGLVANTIYYVTATSLAANTFTVTATLGGGAITTTTAGSGTHTVHSGTSYNGLGIAADDFVDNTQHDLYLLNGDNLSNVRAIRFNMRAALTVTAGFTTNAYVLRTTVSSIVGTLSSVNNARIFTVNHGPYSGVKSLWFVTTTRIHRCSVSGLTSLASGWISDYMIEIPPGGNTTYSPLSTFSQVDYSSTIDRLFVPTTTATRFGTYVGQYDTTGLVPFDQIIGVNLVRLKTSVTSINAIDGLFPQAAVTIWTEGGFAFVIPNSVTTGINWLYVFPVGADGRYASYSNQRIITPKLATLNATKLYRAYVDHAEYVGDYGIGYQPEAYKIYFRTSGIDDNTGAWTEIGINGDLSSYATGQNIQFMIELDTLGETCVPTRIFSIGCTYEDGSQDSHYLPSVTKSSAPSKIFAWQQILSWGSNIPNLELRLFDASTNLLIFSDTTTAAAYGTWEYSTNGTTWLAWDDTQDVVGYYIRYTATSFGYSGVTVRALLTQA